MISQIFRTAQILSLDIVIGVVILLRFFCAQFNLQPSWHIYILLGTTVWLIYTIDHLRDAKKALKRVRRRYQFHWENRKLLKVMVGLCCLLIASLVFFIPRSILFGGLLLAILSFIYLLVQHKLSSYLFKELYVAAIYTAGILMTPFLLAETFNLKMFISLFLLAFINLSIFSWYERDEDLQDGFESIATRINSFNLEKVILMAISLGISLSAIWMNVISIYFLIGFIVFGLMLINPIWFRRKHRYRSIGDAVFLMPIIFEWL